MLEDQMIPPVSGAAAILRPGHVSAFKDAGLPLASCWAFPFNTTL